MRVDRRIDWRTLGLQYGALLAFALSVVVLVTLASWWFVFGLRSIERDHASSLIIHQLTTELLAHEACQEKTLAAAKQRVAADISLGAFEVAAIHGELPPLVSTREPPLRAQLACVTQFEDFEAVHRQCPDCSAFVVQPTPLTKAEIVKRHERRRLMVFGEGGLLITLLLVVLAMLGRLVQAERAFRKEMQDFLGRVTHEMKTPLAGIKAVLQTIQSGRMPPEQLTVLSTMALREVDREEHLVQNLLLAQKLRVPELVLAQDEVDLAALLARFMRHRQETHATLRFELDCAEGLLARGDATAMWTILENLADNAAKYGATQLRIDAKPDNDRAVVRFLDDGQGFDPVLAERLFEPFVRAGGLPVKGHGTGLGLHLSRQLARRMRGDLTAQSPGPGQGAALMLTLAGVDPGTRRLDTNSRRD